MSAIAQRVARGVALLDELDPHWRGRIDWDSLDIDSNQFCIAGQFMGARDTYAYEDFVFEYLDGDRAKTFEYGLDWNNESEIELLNEEWRKCDPRKAEQTV